MVNPNIQTGNLVDAGEVTINANQYRLVRVNDQQAFSREYINEPPFDQGAPPLLVGEEESWDMGGLKSREGIAASSEYGKNTDGRWPYRMMPGPLITTIALGGITTVQPTSIFECLGYVFVCCGRYVFRMDPATDTMVLSKDFGGGVVAVMGLRWETNIGLVCTDAATQSLWKVTAIVPGGPDTWTQTADVVAYRLAAGINRLFKVSKTGVLKNISTGLDPMTEANWADAVQVGDTFSLPTSLISYERTVLIGKPEGLFGVGEEGFGIPLIRRIAYDSNNCYGTIVNEPWVWVPHSRGMYRYQPGLIESVGIEREVMNESPVKGPVRALATDGEWTYVFLDVGNDCYLLVSRDQRGSEFAYARRISPVIWDTLAQWTAAESLCAWVSTSTTPPRLYFGYGVTSLAYIKLQPSGSPPNVDDGYRFSQTGSRYTTKRRYGDWGPKDFPKCTLVAKNLTSARYWTVSYSVDGAAFSNLDVNGAAMSLQADGRQDYFLPLTAVGREIQYKFDLTSNSSTVAPPEINYFESFASPQARRAPIIKFNLQLEYGIHHERSVDTRTSLEQFNDLVSLLESATSVLTVGPWTTEGAAASAWVKQVKLMDTRESGMDEPSLVVEVALQLREVS